MKYKHEQKRKLGFLFFLLIFNVNGLPNTGYFHTKPDIVGHEIISPDSDSGSLTSFMEKSKRPVRNITSFLKIGYVENATCPRSINRFYLTTSFINALNFHSQKMHESFLVTHFSTDI